MNLNPEALMKLVREERANKCRPGSEQEIVWHAIVPERHRKPEQEKKPECPKSLST